MIFNILGNTTKLYMTKYIIGEIFSSGRATLYKNPSDQTAMSELPSLRLFGEVVARSSSSTFPRTLWTTFFHRFEIDFGEEDEFSAVLSLFPVLLEATEAAAAALTSIGEECLLEDTEDTLLLKFSDAECRLLSQANAVDELLSKPDPEDPDRSDLWWGFEVMADLKTASAVEDQDFMCFVTRCALIVDSLLFWNAALVLEELFAADV